MAVFIRLRQDKMGAQDKERMYYAHTVSAGEVDSEYLAEKIQTNTTFSRGEVRGLIDALVDEMKFQMGSGNTVVLNGFGRFHLTVESEGAATPEEFEIDRDIKRVKCKFSAAGQRIGGRNGKIEEVFSKDVTVKWYPGCENGKNLK